MLRGYQGTKAASNANGAASSEGGSGAANGAAAGGEGKGSEDASSKEASATQGGDAAPKKKVYSKVGLFSDPLVPISRI